MLIVHWLWMCTRKLHIRNSILSRKKISLYRNSFLGQPKLMLIRLFSERYCTSIIHNLVVWCPFSRASSPRSQYNRSVNFIKHTFLVCICHKLNKYEYIHDYALLSYKCPSASVQVQLQVSATSIQVQYT